MADPIQDVINSLPKRQLLTIDEVAEFFSVQKRTIYNWYDEETLTGTKIKGSLRIYKQSVITLIQNGNGKKDGETIEEVEIKIQEAGKKGRRIISKGVEI